MILTGDFNTAHNEIDLANPKENEKTPVFCRRNAFGSPGIWNTDLWMPTARFIPTRWSIPGVHRTNARARNIGWRLDYFLVSEGLMERVEDVEIHGEVMGSDHCPVSLILRD